MRVQAAGQSTPITVAGDPAGYPEAGTAHTGRQPVPGVDEPGAVGRLLGAGQPGRDAADPATRHFGDDGRGTGAVRGGCRMPPYRSRRWHSETPGSEAAAPGLPDPWLGGGHGGHSAQATRSNIGGGLVGVTVKRLRKTRFTRVVARTMCALPSMPQMLVWSAVRQWPSSAEAARSSSWTSITAH